MLPLRAAVGKGRSMERERDKDPRVLILVFRAVEAPRGA